MRRRYPRLSTVTQADVVGLLEVGSKVTPRVEVSVAVALNFEVGRG